MKLPRDVNGSEAVRALRRLGFEELRQSGSHVIMRRAGRTVVVPMHRPIKPGTLRGLIEQAGVTVEEFVKALTANNAAAVSDRSDRRATERNVSAEAAPVERAAE